MAGTVIFDMDGVVVDSEVYWGKTDLREFMLTVPELTKEMWNMMSGMSFHDIYRVLCSDFGLRMEKQEFIDIFNRIAVDIYSRKAALLPGFLDFIRSLKQKGFRTGLASSSPSPWIDIVIGRFMLSDLFDIIVSADQVRGRSKPAPDIYLLAAEKLGAEPGRCVAIEDSEHGVSSAKSAGMTCIGMKGGTKLRHDLTGADLVVSDFSELSPERVRELSAKGS